MAGLSIAGSQLVGIGGFVRRHELGTVVDADDPESIAAAIRAVTEQPPPGIADAERLRLLQETVAWGQQGGCCSRSTGDSTVRPGSVRRSSRRSDGSVTSRAPRQAGGLRVAMLLGKRDEYDTRVRKEARTLAAAGYDVRVISVASPDRPALETVGDVTYERVELRRRAREAWHRRRVRQELALQKAQKRLRRRPAREPDAWTGNPTPAQADANARRPSAVAVATARRAYRAKLAAERQAYVWARAWAWHLELRAAVSGALESFDPDVVHSHDLLTLYAGVRCARSKRIPLVYDAHELERHSRRYRTRNERLVVWVVESLGIRAASAVVTVSPEIATWLAQAYRIPVPTVLLNSPPLQLSRTPAPISLREVCGVGPDETLVVFTGALALARGIEPVLAAFSDLPAPFHLALMGPRKAQRETQFREQVAALGLEGRVHLVDPVPGERVGAVIASANAAVVPQGTEARSQDLTLPNKLFDAVLAGLPIAAAGTTSVGAFVRRHELGTLFAIDDQASIARAIRGVVERTPAGIADAERLARLQEEVSWERQGEVLLDLYRRLTTGPPPEQELYAGLGWLRRRRPTRESSPGGVALRRISATLSRDR